MGKDQKYYYDFSKEIHITIKDIPYNDGTTAQIAFSVDASKGKYIFLCPADSLLFPTLTSLSIDGVNKSVSKKDAVYVEYDYTRFGVILDLHDGINEFFCKFTLNGKSNFDKIPFRLIPAEDLPLTKCTKRKIHTSEEIQYPYFKELSFDGFTEGIGRKTSPGRFGFTKGDGLLDCAMPCLGMVDKMFLCGQPKYNKPYRWSYSLIPKGMPLHGSFEPKDVGIENDEIEVNHLSVRWSANYLEKKFTCSYSLASPAILTESEEGNIHLSGLRYAGNYTSILIPREDGVEECDLDSADIRGMKENWIMLFNSTEFPDIPLMLVFDKNPDLMVLTRDEDCRLNSIDFLGVSLMFSLTPFGIERFDPYTVSVSDAIRRAKFWSRAVLAFPIKHREYFYIDEKAEKVTIRQKFEYRFIKDEWNTLPLKTAPLPPSASISGTMLSDGAFDFEFPTKYGYLKGTLGSTSEYTIPMMPTDRRFPIPDKNTKITELLFADLEDFISFSSSFSRDVISYPYAGAHLEAFALASSMGIYMKPSDREFFKRKLEERLRVSLEAKKISDYLILDWREMMQKNPNLEEVKSIYSDKTKKRMQLQNFNKRVEPFTNVDFNICYLNVSYISRGAIKDGTEEEILGLKIPLIENDWGVGLTFYYLYLSALATGSFKEIRNKWDLIKSVYSFFELMHDFACMGTGYSDNAITWVEGANYGAFTSFIKMAEAVGDRDARAFGIYNAAKQFALRLAIMRSSVEYFPKYFDVEPWYVAKHFHEELSPSFAFQNYPNLYFKDFRRDGVYNFTTEGLYPEAYSGLRKFGDEIYATTMQKLQDALVNGLENPTFHWGIIQQYTAMLIDMANDRQASHERFLELVDFGLKHKLIVADWRGIHIFSRALPRNYFLAQILSWEETKKHKAWLISWEETELCDAVYEDDIAKISFKHSKNGKMKIIIGVGEMPSQVLLNGIMTEFVQINSEKIEICPMIDGILEIIF